MVGDGLCLGKKEALAEWCDGSKSAISSLEIYLILGGFRMYGFATVELTANYGEQQPWRMILGRVDDWKLCLGQTM